MTVPSPARKPRAPRPRLLKHIRSQIRLIHTAIVRRRRTRPTTCLSIVLLILFLFIVVTVLIYSSYSSHPTHLPHQVPISPSTRAPATVHGALEAPPYLFTSPSQFAVDKCVRRFDQAWALLDATPSPTPLRPMRIAFAIQASADTIALLPRLLSRMHHQRNLYLIHVDAKTPLSARNSLNRFITDNPLYVQNVRLLPSEMLTYKGISAVVNSLSLMATALDADIPWDYYINLSAADYPLLPPDAIASLLARPRAPLGTLNFVWFFPRSEWTPYSFRVRFMYWDPAASGYQSSRTHLHHMAAQRTNPLDPARAFIFTKAEAWSILSRPFVRYVARSGFSKRMLLAHQHVLSVSEHLITDILFNHPVWRATVVPEAFRKVVWYFHGRRSGQHPYTLDRGPKSFSFWGDLVQTCSLFARKFSKPQSPLMDRIDLRLSGMGVNHSHPDYPRYASHRKAFYNRIVEYFDSITQATLKQQGIQWPPDAYPPI